MNQFEIIRKRGLPQGKEKNITGKERYHIVKTNCVVGVYKTYAPCLYTAILERANLLPTLG